MKTAGLLLCVLAGLAAGPEQEAFDALDARLESLGRELTELRQKYSGASELDRAALAQQFNEKAEQRNALLPELYAAAEKAYLAAPNQNEKVAEVMRVIVASWVEQDRHPQALRLAERLIEHKHPDAGLHELAGIAAFSSDQFAKALSHLTRARQIEHLGERGADLLRLAEEWEKHWQAEQALRAAETKADDLPRVKLETTEGVLVIELYENQAPNSVANFIHLVEKGYYDGTIFHRVLEGFMAQGGDPKGTGSGGPGWAIECECYREDFRRHFSGTLSMAHAGRNTGGSQFFITFVPTHHLDGRHTAFGRVIEGNEKLPEIRRRDPGSDSQATRIIKATVVRKRDHAYDPVKLPSRR